MPYFLFIATSLLWGAGFILMKKAADAWGPVGIAAWRVIAGSSVLLAILLIRRRGWGLRPADVPGMLFIAVTCYVCPFVVQPYFISTHNASALMGMIISLVPLMTILVSVPMLRIYPTRRQLVGVLLGLAFLALLLGDAWHSQHVALGDLLLAVTVPINYAITNTFVKRRFSHTPTMPLTLGALGMAGMILLPISLSLPKEAIRINEHFAVALASLLTLGVLSTGAAYYMFYLMVQKRGPLYAGMVSYILPVIAMALGKLNGEALSTIQYIAMAGVLAAVAVVQYQAKPATPPAGEPETTLPPD